MNQGEYDRIVVGYHGTRYETAKKIINHESQFRPSQNNDDWLGHGVYFWEHAPQQAWKWARQRYASSTRIAVLGSMIRLGTCFDLLDPENGRQLVELQRDMIKGLTADGLPVPRNYNARKNLDCATLNYACEALESGGVEIQSCRGVYVPTESRGRLWERSWLSKDAHIQLCVRDLSCIIGTWLVNPMV